MAKLYKAEWAAQLAKLTDEERTSLLANLKKPNKITSARRVSYYDNVNSFVKAVVFNAEAAYDKAMKERADKKAKGKAKK
jgi:hypothetical protein